MIDAPGVRPAKADVAAQATAGRGKIVAEMVRDRPTLTCVRACSPLKLLTPRSRPGYASAFVGSYGGGLVAGDTLDLNVTLHERAVCFLSTQASTKVYRNTADAPARQRLHATVADDALLVVAPDPLTCFAHANYEQTQRFELAAEGNLVLVDWLTSGRHACGERWAFDRYASRNDVAVAGELRLADALLLDPADGPVDAPFRLGRFECMATVVLIGPKLAAMQQALHDAVNDTATQRHATLLEAASPIADGLVWRLLATTTQAVQRQLRRRLAPLAELLGDDPWGRKW